VEVIDYGKPEPRRPAPLPGRIAAGFFALFIAVYVLLIWYPPSAATTMETTCVGALYSLSSISTLISIIAVSRRSTRTILAWIAFVLCMAWWLFFFLGLLLDL
jgi:hypothetical protein